MICYVGSKLTFNQYHLKSIVNEQKKVEIFKKEKKRKIRVKNEKNLK